MEAMIALPSKDLIRFVAMLNIQIIATWIQFPTVQLMKYVYITVTQRGGQVDKGWIFPLIKERPIPWKLKPIANKYTVYQDSSCILL